MQIALVDIKNFRGISAAKIYFNGHTVVIGDNNAGKSTIFEAIDLVLGPDRLNRTPVIDEHDFYNGSYYNESSHQPKIEIELVVIDLEKSQITKFKDHIEFWDESIQYILKEGSIRATDDLSVKEALRVKFIGQYNLDDDDFEGETWFCSPEREDGSLTKFTKNDKRECGFLYLRALRTGARALSMERGSLLDIILRLKEIRPKMWEDVLNQLRKTDVATDPAIGIKNILESVQTALKEFVPSDWGSEPILRVSDLTREHLRKTLTIFMSTGEGTYHAPFQHQGTGTINTMVLALLSMIAEVKKNVIFAMEEPETAIPPYTQKRIVDSIRRKSTQAIFTSHSPFVLEEFPPDQIILIRRNSNGVVNSSQIHFPTQIKPKRYDAEFRMRFSESLLAKRILLTEGATESSAYSTAGRILNEIAPARFSSLEAMGVSIFDVMSESSISIYGEYFTRMGKIVFAVFDKQDPEALKKINAAVAHPYESSYKGFENLLMAETDFSIIKKFMEQLVANNEWPSHISKPANKSSDEQWKTAAIEYLKHKKGARGAADMLSHCSAYNQIPATIRNVFEKIKNVLDGSDSISETKDENAN